MGTRIYGNLNVDGQRSIEIVEPDDRRGAGKRRGGFVAGTLTAAGLGRSSPFSRNIGGVVATPDGSPLGNGNWACAAGPEILPSEQIKVPLDVGTAYMFQHFINNPALGEYDSKVTAEFNTQKQVMQHQVAFDLYQNSESVLNLLVPARIVLPVRTGAVAAGGATIIGGGTATGAVLNPGDGKYIQFDGSVANSLTFQFNPADLQAAFGNADNSLIKGRIVGLAIRYVAWKDDDSEAVPGEGFRVEVHDSTLARTVELGSWLVQNYRNNSTFETRDLGETNPIARGKTVWPSHDLMPFTIEDMQMMGTANNDAALNNRFFFIITGLEGDLTQQIINFDYIELLVDVIPEQRYSAAIRQVSNANALAVANTGSYTKDVTMRLPISSGFSVPLLNVSGDYFLVVREARPPDISDYYRAMFTGALQVGPMEPYGPSLEILGVLQERAADQVTIGNIKQLYTTKSAVVNDQSVAATRIAFTEYRLAVAHYVSSQVATFGAFWASYRNMAAYNIQRVYTGQSRVQRVWLQGGVEYDRVRALIQPTTLVTEAIQLQVYTNSFVLVANTLQYSPTDIRDGYVDQRNANGWYEILVPLVTPFTPTSDGYYYIAASSAEEEGSPWLVAAAEPMGMQPYFSFDVPGTAVPFGTNSQIVDYAMVLGCNPGVPEAPDVSLIEFALVDNACGIESVDYNRVEWVSDGNWDQYVVVYKTSLNSTFDAASDVFVAGVEGTEHSFDHTAVPWDVTVQYAIVGHRGWDLSQTLGDYSAGTVITSGGHAKLGITEVPQAGDDSTRFSVYTPTTESGPVEISWEYLTQVEKVTLHNENYSRPLVPREDLGRSFTINLLAGYLQVCTAGVPYALTRGQRTLDGAALDFLQSLARVSSVLVQFPGGTVGRYIMELGSMVGSTQFGVFSAEVTFTQRAPSLLNLLGLRRTTR